MIGSLVRIISRHGVDLECQVPLSMPLYIGIDQFDICIRSFGFPLGVRICLVSGEMKCRAG
jgi:hypothetical protein